MVPPESFSIEAPYSSSAFCKGCDGGTQCDNFSSKVFSCADAASGPSARQTATRQIAARPAIAVGRTQRMMSSPRTIRHGRFLDELSAFNRSDLALYSDRPKRRELL